MLKRFVVIFLATLAIFGAQAGGSDGGADAAAIWKQYAVAKKRLQFDLCRLMSSKWTDLGSVLRRRRDQQFAMIELRTMKFDYLIEHHPERVIIGNGLSAFADFEWTAADEDALRESSPEYLKLEAWLERLNQDLAGDPGLTEAQGRMRQLADDEHYANIMSRFNDWNAQLDAKLTRSSRPSNGTDGE